MKQQRDIAVDIVKFFAVFLIINSHADACYPKFSLLATGGAIGDSLFMFVSGFTLYLGKQMRFDNYYKRRINRIYPSAFAATLAIFCLGGGVWRMHSCWGVRDHFWLQLWCITFFCG